MHYSYGILFSSICLVRRSEGPGDIHNTGAPSLQFQDTIYEVCATSVPVIYGYNEIPESGAWTGEGLEAGVYLYKVTATSGGDNTSKTSKLVIMK